MKVIHVISGGDTGGARTHVYSVLKYLNQIIDVQLVCFRGGDFADGAAALGIPTMVLDGGFLPNLAALKKLIRAGEYDLVHCHGSMANVMGAMLKASVHVPVISTVHSDYRLDYLGRPFARAVYGTLNIWALHRLDYRVCVSDPIRQRLIDRGFEPNRLFSIYNGLDFSHVVPKTDRAAYFAQFGYTVHEGDVIAGIAARLDPVKDIPTLIRAVALAQKACPQLRLAIAGDGKERKKLEALTKELGLTDSVFFLGWVNDLDSFYGALDINTLSSLSEAFPYALPEGARMHCATIATAVGGVPYIIEPGVTGLLTQPRDYEAFAQHIRTLAENGAYRLQLAENLHERASRLLSIEATVSHQIQIYETILRRERAPKKKRSGVLICGAYGKGNAGDDAILKAIVRQMKNIDEDMPVYVLSHNPIETRKKYYVGSVHVFNPFAFWHVMRRTKLYLSGGGSLIQDQTSSRSLWYYLWSIRLAKLAGNRVLMYGCGIGPVNGTRNRKMAARIINRCVDAVTLREDMSLAELRAMGVVKPDIRITADPALLLQPGEPGAVESFLQSQGLSPDGAYALYVLRPWPGFEERKKSFAAAAEAVRAQYGLTPVFFALEPDRDTQPCREVAELLSGGSFFISAPQDERLIIGMMRKMRVVVSMRLHTLIFASSVGAPLVAVSYDPKVTGFMRYIGQKHCIAFEDVTQERLTELIGQTLADDEPYCVEHLRQLAAENESAARALLEDTE